MNAEPAPPVAPTLATETYLRTRAREGRLFPDEVVALLPRLPRAHPLGREWRLRGDSSARLVEYLRKLPTPLSVVDAGCGNGWLANRIAAIVGSRVVAVDTNEVELAQARRVFGGRPNLRFVRADIAAAPPPVERPDVIVLASVVQYVPDLAGVLERLLAALPTAGELHIIDSPFYRTAELDDAADRSRRYYEALGVPEMACSYRHHDWRTLAGLGSDVLYRPDSLRAGVERRLLGRARSPFPWIRIRTGR